MKKTDNKNIKEQAEQTVDRWLDSSFMGHVNLFWRTLQRVAVIYGPLSLGVYLVHTHTDRIVIGVGVAFCIISTVNTVNAAYTAEARAKKPRKRK